MSRSIHRFLPIELGTKLHRGFRRFFPDRSIDDSRLRLRYALLYLCFPVYGSLVPLQFESCSLVEAL